VQFSELQQAEREAVQAGLLEPPTTERPEVEFAFQSSEDPNLALAGLRIELERRLRTLADSYGIGQSRQGIRMLLRGLTEKEALTEQEAAVLTDLMPLLNAGAHGAKVEPGASVWAVQIGPRLLRSLDARAAQPSIENLMERWRRRDGAAVTEVGYALSEAAVTSPEVFLSLMQKDPESFEAWLADLQHHTFTVHELWSGPVQQDLYTAFYERLRQLMLEAMNRVTDDPQLARLASEVIATVERVPLHFID
jgi:hypothetical protein